VGAEEGGNAAAEAFPSTLRTRVSSTQGLHQNFYSSRGGQTGRYPVRRWRKEKREKRGVCVKHDQTTAAGADSVHLKNRSREVKGGRSRKKDHQKRQGGFGASRPRLGLGALNGEALN